MLTFKAFMPSIRIMAIELAQQQASPDEQAALGFLASHIGLG
jgi:hypothetical protein